MAAPTVRSFSAEFDPLRLVAQFPARYPGLLETHALHGSTAHASGFDILPISSGECLQLHAGGHLSGPHAAGCNGFLEALERWWQALRLPPLHSPVPFSGGWLLYLSYEVAGEIEPGLRLPPSGEALVALAVRAPAAWVRDRANGKAWLVAEAGAEHWLDAFEDHVRRIDAAAAPDAMPRFDIFEDDPRRFLAAVTQVLEHIAAGDVYQANLSRGWRAVAADPVDPIALYRRLRHANPSPFAALLRHADFALLSSSPERLLTIRDGRVSTRPIAGTRPRGGSAGHDAALRAALTRDHKERAEHVMLIDLERNDLGRVCVPGTVGVDEFMSVETYAHVHHIVSSVSGRLAARASPVDVIRALFPGGTITGCPKFRCMQIIAELEGMGRGAYTGSLGYLNRDGSCDLNILIRTLTAGTTTAQDVGTVRFRAGAGIVADSQPLLELAETRAKAAGLVRAFGSPP